MNATVWNGDSDGGSIDVGWDTFFALNKLVHKCSSIDHFDEEKYEAGLLQLLGGPLPSAGTWTIKATYKLNSVKTETTEEVPEVCRG